MPDSPLTIGIDFGGTSVEIAVVFQSHIIEAPGTDFVEQAVLALIQRNERRGHSQCKN